MSSCVLDASALLALLRREGGAERVALALRRGAAMSAVNLSEVMAKLLEWGLPSDSAKAQLNELRIEVIIFDTDLAYRAGLPRISPMPLGLSFADRACFATAEVRQLPALTTDKQWANFSAGPTIELIR